jgi:hypothetical protein
LQTQNANCRPPGMPSIMRMPYPIEFLFSPDRVTIITETDSQVRRIYTDGRKLPDDPDPTFNGSSVGHWEGKVLVVDTIGLNPDTSLSEGLHPTETTHIQERFEEVTPGHLVMTTTITDPKIYTVTLHHQADLCAPVQVGNARIYLRGEQPRRRRSLSAGRPWMSASRTT